MVMEIYEMKDNKLVPQGGLVEEGKEIIESGNAFAVIKDGAIRCRLLIKNGDVYCDMGEPFLDMDMEELKSICKGKMRLSKAVADKIIKCLACEPALLDIIPNSLYLNIPNFAERLQAAIKIRLYDDYSKCSVDNIDEFLAKAEKDLKKVSDYIEKQEKGKAALDLLTGEKKTEAVETDDKEAADYDAILDHNPTI